MGCMNGKCSDETDSPEEGNNLIARHQPRSAEYSVRPLPETPTIQKGQLVQSDTTASIEESGGRSVSQEFTKDYLVTSTRGIDKKTGMFFYPFPSHSTSPPLLLASTWMLHCV